MQSNAHKPESATHNAVNYVAAACALATLYWYHGQTLSAQTGALFVLAAYALPIVLGDLIVLRTHLRASAALDFSDMNPSLARTAIKIVGVAGSFGFIAFLYWLFPEYHADYYLPFWQTLQSLSPWIAGLTLFYVFFVDRHMREPLDGYYWLGSILIGRRKAAPWGVIAQHLLGWIVKGFFLPLMFVALTRNLHNIQGMHYAQMWNSIGAFYEVATCLLFTFDLIAATTGYVITLRLLDTHIRSAEPTLFGWCICIICYQPFTSFFMDRYLRGDNHDWLPWLASFPLLQLIWGVVALLLLVIYTLASINFGCRFSNLTHRGIITGGMYRFTKHPAYVSKNLMWWFIYVPFVPMFGGVDTLHSCIIALLVNVLYYLRARTEERHLSHDPNYVAYALWMNEHGLFASVARALPFLRYRAPAGWHQFPVPYKGIK